MIDFDPAIWQAIISPYSWEENCRILDRVDARTHRYWRQGHIVHSLPPEEERANRLILMAGYRFVGAQYQSEVARGIRRRHYRPWGED